MSTMVERSDIPKDIMEQAQSVAAHLYAYGSSSYDFASNIIGRALHAERLAAENRGKEEERERWKPAAVYFDRYCQDEAAELECCLSEQQHTDAKAFAAAIRGS